jgi:CheY-like chemotaxis protein
MDPALNRIVFYILVVDDDQDDQFFLRKALTDKIPQAIVESLYDGSEALQYLNSCTSLPNLIFLDLNMMKLSGKETIKVIRRNKYLNKVPVVILTTSRNASERSELINLGANAFYTKPDNPDALMKIVEEVGQRWLTQSPAENSASN